MASEASRKKARETCDHDHNTVGCWTCGTLQPCKPCEAIAAALDEAQERGREQAAATISESVSSAREAFEKGLVMGRAEGAQRERWECHKIANATVSSGSGLGHTCWRTIASRIRSRGPMRGPEE